MDETLESFPNGLFNAPRVARARKSMLRLQADLSAMRLNSSRWRWKKYCHASCLERVHFGKPDFIISEADFLKILEPAPAPGATRVRNGLLKDAKHARRLKDANTNNVSLPNTRRPFGWDRPLVLPRPRDSAPPCMTISAATLKREKP